MAASCLPMSSGDPSRWMEQIHSLSLAPGLRAGLISASTLDDFSPKPWAAKLVLSAAQLHWFAAAHARAAASSTEQRLMASFVFGLRKSEISNESAAATK